LKLKRDIRQKDYRRKVEDGKWKNFCEDGWRFDGVMR
jgi:hypothetical protein